MYESKKKYNYGTGRRKSSVARVRVYENGTIKTIIYSHKPHERYFFSRNVCNLLRHYSNIKN